MMSNYKFKEGFEIRTRLGMNGSTFRAMGETHIAESTMYDVFVSNEKVGTKERYNEAKQLGFYTVSNRVIDGINPCN